MQNIPECLREWPQGNTIQGCAPLDHETSLDSHVFAVFVEVFGPECSLQCEEYPLYEQCVSAMSK